MTHEPDQRPAANRWVGQVGTQATWATNSWPPNVAQQSGTGRPQVWRSAAPQPAVGTDLGWSAVAPAGPADDRSAERRDSSGLYQSLIWLSLMLVALTVLLLSFALWDRPVTHLDGAAPSAVSRAEWP